MGVKSQLDYKHNLVRIRKEAEIEQFRYYVVRGAMFRGCGRESGDNRVGQFVCTTRVQSTNQLNRCGFATVAQYRNVQQAKPPQLNDLCHHLGPVCPTWDLKVSSRKREFCTTTTRLVFSFFPVSMRPRLKRRPALVVQLKRVK